jgi:hypothetical protein
MGSPAQAQTVNGFNNQWACFSQPQCAMLGMGWFNQLAIGWRKREKI